MQHRPFPREGARVLVVGSVGREHALVWNLAQSPLLGTLWAAPGNPGIAQQAACINLAADDVPALTRFAVEQRCDLVVVGPEDPLAAGLVDALAEQGLRAFGPTRAAASLESSKRFTSELASRLGLPIPHSASFSDFAAARAYVREQGQLPIVLKADGLYRGKGVVIATTLEEAEATLQAMLVAGEFGAAGRTVVVQEFLRGEERSFIALCDGRRALLLLPSKDHKRAYDGDRGPNTGGMGVVAPLVRHDDPSAVDVLTTFFLPVLAEMAARGTPYRGALYANVMMTGRGPLLLEFNARLGDPEAEALLPLLENDLLPLLVAAADGDLSGQALRWHSGCCATVVMASGGYPDHYQTGLPISGLEAAAAVPGALVFHAGTAARDGAIVTAGGRVLCVAGRGTEPEEAVATAYQAVRRIHWEGAQYRSDIGWNGEAGA
jgi:phosphoribosylamine--glycine ligase